MIDEPEIIYGFYEERYPIYTNEKDCHPELSYPMSVEEANGLVTTIKELEAEVESLRRSAKDLAQRYKLAEEERDKAFFDGIRAAGKGYLK